MTTRSKNRFIYLRIYKWISKMIENHQLNPFVPYIYYFYPGSSSIINSQVVDLILN